MSDKQHLSMTHLLLALLVILFWGFNFVFAKAAVTHFPPFTMLVLRMAMVVCTLLPFFPRPPLPIKTLCKISISFAVLHLGCMYTSLHLGLWAAVGIITQQIGIPFVLIMGVILFKERIGIKSITGVILAIIGTYFLMSSPNSIANPFAFSLMIASAFFWSIYSILLKKVEIKNPIALVTWVSFISMIMILPIALIFESNHLEFIKTADSFVWLSVMYTAFAASVGAHGLWCYLLSKNPVHTVAPITLLVPLLGILGGVMILNEPLSNEMIWGATLMTIGVGTVLIRKPKSAVPRDIDA